MSKTKKHVDSRPLRRFLHMLFAVVCCVAVLCIVPVCVGCAMIVRKYPIVLLLILPVVCCVWMGMRILRKRRWRKAVALGVDFGLQNDWLLELPQLLESYGVPAKKPLSKKLVLPPLFREVAVKYSSVKRKKGSPLFSRKLMSELRVGCKDGKDYYCFSGQDEEYYCVRVSDSDETIYKLELELSMPPVPFASDINRYFALRYFQPNDD